MKILITISLLTCFTAASAQQKNNNNLSKSIHDDGKKMTVDIRGDVAGHTVKYYRSFNVTGMSPEAKNALTQHIADSLGISAHQTTGQPNVPAPPVLPVPPTEENDKLVGNRDINSSFIDDGKTMRVKISGYSKDKTFTYDRAFNVNGMSFTEKNALVKRITDSLGISKNVRLNTK